MFIFHRVNPYFCPVFIVIVKSIWHFSCYFFLPSMPQHQWETKVPIFSYINFFSLTFFYSWARMRSAEHLRTMTELLLGKLQILGSRPSIKWAFMYHRLLKPQTDQNIQKHFYKPTAVKASNTHLIQLRSLSWVLN